MTVKNIGDAKSELVDYEFGDDVEDTLLLDKNSISLIGGTNGTFEVVNQKISAKVTLKGGESAKLTFQAQVTDKANEKGKVSNAMLVSGNTPPPPVVENPVPKAEAEKHVFDSTGKKIDGESVKVGDFLTYELTVKNIGDAKSELVDYEFGDDVEDTLLLDKNSISLIGGTNGTFEVVNQKISAKVTLKGGESAKLTFQAQVTDKANEKGKVSNAMLVSGNTPPPPVVENPVGKLESSKQVFNKDGTDIGGKTVQVGDVLTYEITAKNTGNKDSVLKDVMITDEVPAVLELDTASVKLEGAKGDVKVNGQTITAKIDNLKGGELVKLIFQVKVTNKAKGEVKNIAVVKVPGIPPQYPEVPIVVPPTPRDIPNTDDGMPKTGEISHLELVALGAICIIIAMYIYRKKISSDI
ncbi:hypothetical protein RsY01_1228 [Lactococcus reticulitermitis]|uniref:DUF11 domain-containing protein n=1 Tax=Pseudolactococcus reticulitermitis TaxID=2025039 RepID=A0A224X029_9LACT|nr:hypothetical protein RsY01_1228 [Lactococcus reticulitermitis]